MKKTKGSVDILSVTFKLEESENCIGVSVYVKPGDINLEKRTSKAMASHLKEMALTLKEHLFDEEEEEPLFSIDSTKH